MTQNHLKIQITRCKVVKFVRGVDIIRVCDDNYSSA